MSASRWSVVSCNVYWKVQNLYMILEREIEIFVLNKKVTINIYINKYRLCLNIWMIWSLRHPS